MNTTFNFWLNNKPNREGKYDIFIRVTQNRKHKSTKAGWAVERDRFDPTGQGKWIKGRDSDAKKGNDHLLSKLNEISELYRDLDQQDKNPSKEKVIKAYRGDFHNDFMEYLTKNLQRLEKSGKVRSRKRYNQFYNKLDTFLGGEKLPFDQISFSFIKDFQAFLIDQGLHQNTIYEHFKNFKATINSAIQEDLMKPERNPFLKKLDITCIPTNKSKLTTEEINRIEELDLPYGSEPWHIRNYFMFSFFQGGVRIGDLITLKWKNITNDGFLEYIKSKNSKNQLQWHRTPLLPETLEILANYGNESKLPDNFIFGILPDEISSHIDDEKNIKKGFEKKFFASIDVQVATINKQLKKIAESAKIEKHLSTHIARHSCAEYLSEKGTAPRAMQLILGHGQFKTTERTYITPYQNKLVINESMKAFDGWSIKNVDSKIA